MQKFIVALLSVIALLGLVIPSSAFEVSHVDRETNADRLARGLPPNPPTRRSTAKRHKTSSTPLREFIEVVDLNGNVLGFLDSVGARHLKITPTPIFPVNFDPTSHTISSAGGNELGGKESEKLLAPGSSSFVLLQKFKSSDVHAELGIWSLNPDSSLSATWTNEDGSTILVDFILKGGSIRLTGDATGSQQVNLILVTL